MSSIIFFIIGFFVSTFTLLQVIIILFFGIPTVKYIDKLGLLKKNNHLIRNYYISLALISIIYLIAFFLIKRFFPDSTTPFIFGALPMFFFGLPKIGKNKENVSDFVETNKEQFNVHPWEIIKVLLPDEAAAHSERFSSK